MDGDYLHRGILPVDGNTLSKQMNWTLTDDQIFRISVAVVVIVGLLLLVAVRRAPQRPDRCPIDGQVAEWSKRTGANSCEYGHFSPTERTIHKWSAACP